jgi:two-component system cell cycle sensor histidine kinase/response regulator CckA
MDNADRERQFAAQGDYLLATLTGALSSGESPSPGTLTRDASPAPPTYIVWRTDAGGFPRFGATSWAAFTGRDPKELASDPAAWLDTVHPDDRAHIVEAWNVSVATGELFSAPHRLRRYDGAWRLMYSRMAPWRDEDGRIREWIGLETDETDAATAYEASQRAQHQVLLLLNNIPDAAWFADLEGRFLAVNDELARRAGRPASEIVGRSVGEIWGSELAAIQRAQDQEVIALRRRLVFEREVMRADGSTQYFEVVKAPCYDPAGQIVGSVGLERDVTAQRRLEAQLRQAQKMEALGQLAAGVAHDFNNLLMAILGNVGLLRARLEPGSPEDVDAEEIHDAAKRGADLTRQLLVLSRKPTARTDPVDVNAVVRDAERLLRRLAGDRVMLQVGLAAPPAVVLGDAGQLGQVLINLVVNARDALADRPNGTITITVEHHHLTEAEVLGRGLAGALLEPGDYVMLSVQDTGTGMDAATQARMFDPFFTTKPEGLGTGLGLAVVYEIITRARGALGVESTEGAGSVLTVYLPALTE